MATHHAKQRCYSTESSPPMTYRWTTNVDTPIAEDGVLSPATVKALQYGLGIPDSGTLDTGSVTALQRFLFGVVPVPAGTVGPVTTKALETKLGAPVTGQVPWVHNTVLALQHALNQGQWGLGVPPPPSSGWVSSSGIDNHNSVLFSRYVAGGSVASWCAAACKARGITDPTAVAAWSRGCETAISRESSGNANACNTSDSNNVTPSGYSMVHDYGDGYGSPSGYLGGQLVNYQCSRGVLQCIPQTFASNHCPGTSGMIYDPVANIAAAMGYVVSRYGVSHDGHDLAAKVEQFDPSRPPRGY
jgi:hypothetical protein